MAEYLLVSKVGKVNIVSGNEQYGIVEDVKGVDCSYFYRVVP